jgi:hypothetical protein
MMALVVMVRLLRSDPDAASALRRAVQSSPKLLLVAQLVQTPGPPLEQRAPFEEIAACAGDWLDCVLLIDDGRPEGMWRDPLRSLLDGLFTADPATASAAAAGYVLVHRGRALTWFRRNLWDPAADAEAITLHLSTLVPGLVPFKRPGTAASSPPPSQTHSTVLAPDARTDPYQLADLQAEENTPTLQRPKADVRDPAEARAESIGRRPLLERSPGAGALPPDPHAVLGVAPGATFEQVRQAWRARITQYHPDKVAHLAPEFRALAEQKTRELNEALAALAKALGR